MAVRIRKGTALASLSLTPLIDVVFLLLIFFLVATRFAEEDQELDVVLPSASEAMPLTIEPKQLIVNIDRDGGYFVERDRVDAGQLDRLLERAAGNNPLSQSVLIRADRRVAFDAVVQVMNLCNKHQIRDYSVSTAADDAG